MFTAKKLPWTKNSCHCHKFCQDTQIMSWSGCCFCLNAIFCNACSKLWVQHSKTVEASDGALGSSTYKSKLTLWILSLAEPGGVHTTHRKNDIITTKHPHSFNFESRSLKGTFGFGHSAVSVPWDAPLALVHPVLSCRDFRDHKAPRPTCHHTSTDKAQRGWTTRAHHGTMDFAPQKTFCTNL